MLAIDCGGLRICYKYMILICLWLSLVDFDCSDLFFVVATWLLAVASITVADLSDF